MAFRLRAILILAVVTAAIGVAHGDEREAAQPATSPLASWFSRIDPPRAALAPVGQAQRFGGVCQDCDLSDRRLPGLRIADGDFSRARFSRSFMVRLDASGSIFEGADFTLANLAGGSLSNAKADGARFAGAQLNGLDASRASMSGADFGNAEASETNFSQTVLIRARFVGANVAKGNFLRANLTGARFDFAQLDEADFTQANLAQADFANARLAGAKLAEAQNLSRTALAAACGDERTRLPPGFPRLRPCS